MVALIFAGLFAATISFGPSSAVWTGPARTPTVRTHSTSESSKSTTVNGLTISLRVSPKRVTVGAPVTFRLSIGAVHATGALWFMARYGDGTGRTSGPIPMYCLASPGMPEHETWQFTHAYHKAGVYRIVANGDVNCSGIHAVARATITVT
jgi:hypothetical protein